MCSADGVRFVIRRWLFCTTRFVAFYFARRASAWFKRAFFPEEEDIRLDGIYLHDIPICDSNTPFAFGHRYDLFQRRCR